jgi:hypothetical protein
MMVISRDRNGGKEERTHQEPTKNWKTFHVCEASCYSIGRLMAVDRRLELQGVRCLVL